MYMDTLNENQLDQMYSTLLAEHTRLMSEMKNSEKFDENNHQHTLVSTMMKSLLKLKSYKQKLRMKE